MNTIKLALLNIKKNLKNEKELKSSFIISVIGMIINNSSFVVLWYFFGKTVGELNGWSAMDIFGLYAFSTLSFGLVSAFFHGIIDIPRHITTGNLDKFLLTPKNVLTKVATSSVSTSAIGDILFGLICFVIFAISEDFTIAQLLLSALLLICSTIIFFSVTLMCMSVSFYLMDGHNVSDALYGTFLSNSLYHGGAYTGILKVIFTYIMPALLLGALPVEISKSLNLGDIVFIVISSLFWLFISIKFFYLSLKKYESNNFFGFGG